MGIKWFVCILLIQLCVSIKLPDESELYEWKDKVMQLSVEEIEETSVSQQDFNDFVTVFSLGFIESYSEMSGELDLEVLLDSLEQKKTEIYSSWEKKTEASTEDDCFNCKLTIRPIQAIWFRNGTQEAVISLVKKVCPILDRLDIVSNYICEGAIDTFAKEVIKIVGHILFEPLEVCAFRGKCVKEEFPPFQVNFPKPKPPVSAPKPPTNGTQRLYIIQFADVHYDPLYTEGLEAECGDPVCCRPPNPIAKIRPAGRWGDYNCDSSKDLLLHMFDFASKLPYKYEFAIWSGDIPPHDVWESDKDAYIKLMAEMSEELRRNFPGLTIFPAIGNHEAVPIDFFSPRSVRQSEFSMEWLYNALGEQWSPWLPSDAVKTLKQFGNYEVSLGNGIRVISLNDESCSANNQWLRMRWEGVCCEEEKSNPDGTLTWLINVLQDAEDKKQVVHMIRHVPNSSRCTKEWSSNFDMIVNRYESTIAAIYTGHVHNDEFIIHYRDGSSRTQPTVVEYICPSATTFTKGNPAFRIYEIDAETKLVINHLTYFTNLTEANERGEPIWQLEYSATEAFNMENTFPESWHKLTVEFENNQGLFDKYYDYFFKSYRNGRTCEGQCRYNAICGMRSATTVRDPCSFELTQADPLPTCSHNKNKKH